MKDMQAHKKRKLIIFSILMTLLLNGLLVWFMWGKEIQEALGF